MIPYYWFKDLLHENPVIEPKYQYCITLQLNTYETKESNKNTGRKWWEKTFTIRHQKITSKVQLRHGEIHRDGGGGGCYSGWGDKWKHVFRCLALDRR